ncbi:MAG: YMGG-like glycine zipper-containing protein [Myxococcota bacterium]
MAAGPLGAQSLVVFPAKGQTPEQQAKDQGECQAWAKQNTGVDPLAVANEAAEPPPVAAAPAETGRRGGERVRGAAGGAAAGAAIGAIAGDAGKGAAIGAAGGAMAGGVRKRRSERAMEAAREDAQTESDREAQARAADAQQKMATFNRAYSACLEGKGYTVK